MEPQILNNNESAYTHRAKINQNFIDLADEANEALERAAIAEANKIDKVPTAVGDNFVAFDNEGNLKDSGVPMSAFDGGGTVALHNTSADAHAELFAQKANANQLISATLTAGGWSTTIPYSQVLTVPGITTGSKGIIGVSDVATQAQYQMAAAANLRKIAQTENTIIIMAYGEKPTVDIPIEILIMG